MVQGPAAVFLVRLTLQSKQPHLVPSSLTTCPAGPSSTSSSCSNTACSLSLAFIQQRQRTNRHETTASSANAVSPSLNVGPAVTTAISSSSSSTGWAQSSAVLLGTLSGQQRVLLLTGLADLADVPRLAVSILASATNYSSPSRLAEPPLHSLTFQVRWMWGLATGSS